RKLRPTDENGGSRIDCVSHSLAPTNVGERARVRGWWEVRMAPSPQPSPPLRGGEGEIPFESLQRFLHYVALLAERETDEMIWLAAVEEHGKRNKGDLGFANQAFAEGTIRLVRQCANAGGEKVSAFAWEHLEADA